MERRGGSSAMKKNYTKNIILAEDDPLNQKIAVSMLKKLGYHVNAVCNGLEVLRALEDQFYDLVLMDIQMPVMNGIEAIELIRKRWSPGPKIVVVTAFALDLCCELCFDAGADDLLAKPLKRDELKAAIERNMPSAPIISTEIQPLASELST